MAVERKSCVMLKFLPAWVLRVENVLKIEMAVALDKSLPNFVRVDAFEPPTVDRFEVVKEAKVERLDVVVLRPMKRAVVLV
jgi:hypothetical protein